MTAKKVELSEADVKLIANYVRDQRRTAREILRCVDAIERIVDRLFPEPPPRRRGLFR